MKALMKCHFSYLINKKNSCILCFILLICVFVFIINASGLEPAAPYDRNNILYFELCYSTIKTIVIFVTSFFYCNMFSRENNEYYYLICYYVSRLKFFLTKAIVILLGELLFVAIICFAYHICGYVCFSKYVFSGGSFCCFLNIFLMMQFYGLLAFAIYQALKTPYAVLVAFSIYIFGMIINEEQGALSAIVNAFFPYLSEKGGFYYGAYHSLFLIFALASVNFYLFSHRDM